MDASKGMCLPFWISVALGAIGIGLAWYNQFQVHSLQPSGIPNPSIMQHIVGGVLSTVLIFFLCAYGHGGWAWLVLLLPLLLVGLMMLVFVLALLKWEKGGKVITPGN